MQKRILTFSVIIIILLTAVVLILQASSEVAYLEEEQITHMGESASEADIADLDISLIENVSGYDFELIISFEEVPSSQ